MGIHTRLVDVVRFSRTFSNGFLAVLMLTGFVSCRSEKVDESGQSTGTGSENGLSIASTDNTGVLNSKSLRYEPQSEEFEEALLMELQGDQTDEAALRMLLEGYLQNNANRAMVFFVEAAGVSSYELINEVVRDYLLRDFSPKRLEEALVLLEERPDIATPLLGMVAKVWAVDEPVQAYDWLCAHSDLSGVANAAAIVGAEIGEKKNPAEILGRIESANPPLNVVTPFIRGLIETWAETGNNPEAAGEWLNIFPPQEVVDEAVYSYVNQAKVNDPQAAMSWAESIADEGLRRSALSETAAFWDKKNPDAFAQWRQKNRRKDLP